jgi:tripartite-type tricarboxylate transporter receptor subunit TctC
MMATRMKRLFTLAALGLSGGLSGLTAAQAQEYPDRPIRVIVPFTAASPNDLVARATMPRLSEILKQPIVIENIPGAGNVIGIQAAARAKPDGYTLLLLGQSASAITPYIFANPPYSLEKQFTPVHLTASFMFLLAINAQVPANTLQEFISLAKSKPNALFYGTTGPASGTNIAMLQFMKKAGIKITQVNYKGGADILTAMQRGDVQAYFSVPQSAITGVQSGKVRVLGATSTVRHRDFPNVPSFAEQGVNMISKSWYGLVAPMGVPEAIVEKINAAMNQTIKSPEVVSRLLGMGFEVEGGSVAEFARFMRDEQAELRPIIVEAGIKGD